LSALDHFGFFARGPHAILLGLLDLDVAAAIRNERLLRLILLLSPVLLLDRGVVAVGIILGLLLVLLMFCTTDYPVVLTNVRIDPRQKVGVGIEHKFTCLRVFLLFLIDGFFNGRFLDLLQRIALWHLLVIGRLVLGHDLLRVVFLHLFLGVARLHLRGVISFHNWRVL
jgi:hypothetical protein